MRRPSSGPRQIRDGIDIDAAVRLLYGPRYFRLLVKTGPLNPGFVETVLDLARRGLQPRRRAR